MVIKKSVRLQIRKAEESVLHLVGLVCENTEWTTLTLVSV